MASSINRQALSTSSLPGDLDEKLQAISRAGFDGIILRERDVITFAANAADVGSLVAEHGLTVDLFQITFPESVARRGEESILERFTWTFEQMRALGATLLELSMEGQLPRHPDPAVRNAVFHRVAEAAAEAGVRIGLRPSAGADPCAQIAIAREIIASVGHPTLGLVLDSLLLMSDGALSEIARLDGSDIVHIVLSDTVDTAIDMKRVSRHFRDLPGEGDLDLPGFCETVAATGYQGPWGVEISGQWASERACRPLAADAYRSIIHLMDEVSRRAGQTFGPLEGVPAPSRILGVEFVEFTADETEARVLGNQLRSLGFSPIGQHVNKRVTLWRQGGINIVINTETSGFAHSAYVMHGTSVCDFGLLVEDASAAMARAHAFGASIFSQRRGEGELDIPAVRGLGGSVMHFLDRRSELAEVWDTEFRSLDGAASAPHMGLLRIDHVAQTMTREEMAHWTLFNLSVFDVGKTRTLDVADPGGPVPSRAIANEDGSFRLTLNGVDSNRTFAGQFVEGRHGSSFQHIAFASDDLVETAKKLEQNGFDALELAADYYGDLSTRFDLDPDFTETLKSHSILYDEDEDGAYLQLYSKPYAAGFFFEIVERRGGYSGYGAWNAPYRTAAFKRRAD